MIPDDTFIFNHSGALRNFDDHEARLRDGHDLRHLPAAIEDRAQILAVHELERDEERVLDFAEIEDLSDVRVVELHRDLRFIDEHLDELFVLGNVGKDALDREQALEAFDTEGLGLEDLGHAADVHPLEQVIFPERDGLLHSTASTSHAHEQQIAGCPTIGEP